MQAPQSCEWIEGGAVLEDYERNCSLAPWPPLSWQRKALGQAVSTIPRAL